MEKKVGRPKEEPDREIDKFPENWTEIFTELYSVGASDKEIKSLILKWRNTFSNDLWDRWMVEDKQFSETIKNGRIHSESWWETEGRTNLKDGTFNYTGWYMNMKNRFKWTDRQDSTVSHNGSLSILNLDPLEGEEGEE